MLRERRRRISTTACVYHNRTAVLITMRFNNDNCFSRRASPSSLCCSSQYSRDWLLHAQGVYEAWNALKEWQELPEDQQPPCFGLSLVWSFPSREAGDLRFATQFEQLFSKERRMQVLELKDATFHPESPNEPAYRRFMSETLPHHPHLHTIVFEECRISSSFIEMLFSATSRVEGVASKSQPSSSSSRIKCVEFRQTKLDSDAVVAIARHLDSNETASASCLEQLRFNSCGLSTESCNLLLRSLRTNKSLRVLVLERNYVFDIDQRSAQALGENDTLTTLVLEEPMLGLEQGDATSYARIAARSNAGVSSSTTAEAYVNLLPQTSLYRSMEPVRRLAEALRRNKCLQVLHVPVSEGRDLSELHPLEELIDKHNYSLCSVKAGYEYSSTDPVQRSVQVLLERNELYRQLEAAQFVVEPIEAWPSLLPRVSSQPSLLYKFLRHEGNVSLMSHHTLTGAAQKTADSGEDIAWRAARLHGKAREDAAESSGLRQWSGDSNHKRGNSPVLVGERIEKRVVSDKSNWSEPASLTHPDEGRTM